jgi:hypothetical protein
MEPNGADPSAQRVTPVNFTPRKLLFKAWNQQTKLLMRLNSIDCVKGELFRKDHVLLQFTGLCDQKDEEIYEMDVVLIGGEKFVVLWDPEQNGWGLSAVSRSEKIVPLQRETLRTSIRICNYFESRENA